jgi:L-ascorbate metabolism protein UlaG (beta-lactamase superfamily)
VRRRLFIALLAGWGVLLARRIADAFCNPALVRLFDGGRDLAQIRSGRTPKLGNYFVEWFGHSSFLIQSGGQTKVVTDPNLHVTPGIDADAVTVSNDHITHNNVDAVAGKPVVLRGITWQQTWNPIRTSVKDITIVNIPSRRGAAWGAIANSIFLYEMGSLCLAHLGNMGHLLTPEQEKVLNRVDVLMVPIDAMTNLGFEDVLKVIEQVHPPIVIPMHYDAARQADLFAEFVAGRYPVRRLSESQLVLNRATLPTATEIFILKHPRAFFPWE